MQPLQEPSAVKGNPSNLLGRRLGGKAQLQVVAHSNLRVPQLLQALFFCWEVAHCQCHHPKNLARQVPKVKHYADWSVPKRQQAPPGQTSTPSIQKKAVQNHKKYVKLSIDILSGPNQAPDQSSHVFMTDEKPTATNRRTSSTKLAARTSSERRISSVRIVRISATLWISLDILFSKGAMRSTLLRHLTVCTGTLCRTS